MSERTPYSLDIQRRVEALFDHESARDHDELLANGASTSWRCVPISEVIDAIEAADNAARAAAPPVEPETVYSCVFPGCARQKGHVGPCLNRLLDVDTVPPSPDRPAGLLRQLVALVRIGFLVKYGDRRAEPDDVKGERYRPLLMTILEAEDTESAAALLDSEGLDGLDVERLMEAMQNVENAGQGWGTVGEAAALYAAEYARLSGEVRRGMSGPLTEEGQPVPPGLGCGPGYGDHEWNRNGAPTFCMICRLEFPDWRKAAARAAAPPVELRPDTYNMYEDFPQPSPDREPQRPADVDIFGHRRR